MFASPQQVSQCDKLRGSNSDASNTVQTLSKQGVKLFDPKKETLFFDFSLNCLYC